MILFLIVPFVFCPFCISLLDVWEPMFKERKSNPMKIYLKIEPWICLLSGIRPPFFSSYSEYCKTFDISKSGCGALIYCFRISPLSNLLRPLQPLDSWKLTMAPTYTKLIQTSSIFIIQLLLRRRIKEGIEISLCWAAWVLSIHLGAEWGTQNAQNEIKNTNTNAFGGKAPINTVKKWKLPKGRYKHCQRHNGPRNWLRD